LAQSGVPMVVAYVEDVHASWKAACHHVANGVVEDRFLHSWIGGAESFPVAKDYVKRGKVAIANKYGP
jgi:hypothetical protein